MTQAGLRSSGHARAAAHEPDVPQPVNWRTSTEPIPELSPLQSALARRPGPRLRPLSSLQARVTAMPKPSIHRACAGTACCTGVPAATVGYDHGYRLPLCVEWFVERRAG